VDELRGLFDPYFDIMDLRTMEISAKFAGHSANYAFMEKKRKQPRSNIGK
jgi:hypothetical protein